MKFAFILLLLVIVYVFFNYDFENFYQFENNMLIFTRLNNTLLKKFNIGSSLILDNNDLKHLFKVDNMVRMIVPPYNSVRIIYKNEDSFTKTFELSEGSYDLAKIINNQEIYAIEAFYNSIYVNDIFYVPTRYPIYYNKFPNYYRRNHIHNYRHSRRLRHKK
jgi:hypothetical protein